MSHRVKDADDMRVAPVEWKTAPARGSKARPGGAQSAPEPPQGTELWNQGYQEGLREGRAQGKAEVAPAMANLAKAIEDTALFRERLRRETEVELVKLALNIARRVLSRELSVDPDSVHALVKVALDKLRHGELLRVRFHPSHERPIREHLERNGTLHTVDLLPEIGLRPGDIVLETARGSLDASVESQLREVEQCLLDRTGGAR